MSRVRGLAANRAPKTFHSPLGTGAKRRCAKYASVRPARIAHSRLRHSRVARTSQELRDHRTRDDADRPPGPSRRSAMAVRPARAAAPRRPPPAVGPEVLAAALAASPEASRCSTSRAAASTSIPAGVRAPRRARATICWDGRAVRGPDGAAGRRARGDCSGGGHRARCGSASSSSAGDRSRTGDGRRLTVLTFRDVTDVRVQRRRFTAFATAAANVAYAGSLRGTLDAICAELVETTDLAGAQIFLIDDSGTRMRVHGAAPVHRWPSDFAAAPRGGPAARGAAAARSRRCGPGRPVVTRRRKAQMLADPAWAPAARPARQLRLGGLRRRARWSCATARSARSTPTAGPTTTPTRTRSRS